MSFPCNEPVAVSLPKLCNGQHAALLTALFGNAVPASFQATLYSEKTKKLVLVLEPRGPAALKQLQPDVKAMMAAHDGSAFKEGPYF